MVLALTIKLPVLHVVVGHCPLGWITIVKQLHQKHMEMREKFRFTAVSVKTLVYDGVVSIARASHGADGAMSNPSLKIENLSSVPTTKCL